MIDQTVFFVITLQKLNLFIFTCVFVISEGYTANMQRSRSTFPHTPNSSLTFLHPHPIVKSESNAFLHFVFLGCPHIIFIG